MARTDGNPIIWGVEEIGAAGRHLGSVAERIGGRGGPLPEVRRIEVADLREVLRKGVEDFAACRTDVAFLVVLYPVIGLVLAWVAFNASLLPLLFPLMSGFALIGPVAAVGLYELSRQREMGREPGWGDAFAFLSSPSFGAIFVLGLLLFAIFAGWLLAAGAVYGITLGPDRPLSAGAFVRDTFTTAAGWAMIVIGVGVGFCFAALVLAISVVSFPMLLDRDVGLPAAMATSMRVAAKNPGPIAVWGLIVAGSLAIGSIPAFLGLIVVMPVLGHATWHLYRKTVEPPAERPAEAASAPPDAPEPPAP